MRWHSRKGHCCLEAVLRHSRHNGACICCSEAVSGPRVRLGTWVRYLLLRGSSPCGCARGSQKIFYFFQRRFSFFS